MWDACLGDLLVGYIFKHYLHRIRIFCLIAKVLIVIQIMEPKPTNKRPLSKISGWYFCHDYINKNFFLMEVKVHYVRPMLVDRLVGRSKLPERAGS